MSKQTPWSRQESARKHHLLGLIQFDNEVESLLQPTSLLSSFERIIDDVEPRGQTAIYSSLVHAVEMLRPYAGKTLRIVALTDGQNNTGVDATTAVENVRGIGAVVDAIIVGNQPDKRLRQIVEATGGECFQIQNTTEGFELLEAESVVSLAARGGPRPVDGRALDEIAEKAIMRPDVVKRQRHEVAVGKVADIKSVAQTSNVKNGSSGANVKRALGELQQVAKGDEKVWLHKGQGVHIFPSEEDLCVWRCLIEGPAGSPFAGGVFALTVRLPSDYPFRPPNVRFETPVYHCNISESGQPCLDVLDSSWSPALSVPKVLEHVRDLLADPDPNNALRQWVAELTLAHANTGGTDTRYVDNASKETALHASKTVEEWKAIWGI
eukprot:gnl/TRDRNA2_/TRDRNA2_169758_c0_seq2.p1 gnl/TRDRNA2_/TRDRNA2_169758_c0~~gnl/TRDRNA2_/TRDRNA2_169758_c0_seq2.p1  ORF type:complete len:381 (-),score=50.40 gnl/TRDRNA2_/TRDRNA2_169758_c0_seq2:306-1448(-)